MADRAHDQWLKQVVTHRARKVVRPGILVLVSDLGCRYQEAFARRTPIRPTEKSPFSAFVEAVRKVAIDQKIAILNNFNDPVALLELEQLRPGALVAFVRRHAQTLEDRWSKADGIPYTPERYRAPS